MPVEHIWKSCALLRTRFLGVARHLYYMSPRHMLQHLAPCSRCLAPLLLHMLQIVGSTALHALDASLQSTAASWGMDVVMHRLLGNFHSVVLALPPDP